MISTNEVTNVTAGTEQVPTELRELKERIQVQPASVRAELEPLIDEVMEHALFRGRVMMIARDALQRFRVRPGIGPVRPGRDTQGERRNLRRPEEIDLRQHIEDSRRIQAT